MENRTPRVAIIGAGIGGLVAAIDLASQGLDVTVLERAATVGGKLRDVEVGGTRIDAGPTVFTMRWVFDAIFADAGTTLADHLTLRPATVLARHAWSGTERLDLFADLDRSADAIAAFAGPAEARGFRNLSARAAKVFGALDHSFMRAPLPSPLGLVRAAGLREMLRASPFDTLWRALGEHFRDPRLRQLFGRYATYNGSSPFLAPATLMLIAHAERAGVWLVEGGMHRIAVALAGLAAAKGAPVRTGAAVAEITVAGGRASGVRLASGETLEADAVVVNADARALAAGLFGRPATIPAPAGRRSLSAVTIATLARTAGFGLLRHNVFFSADYAREFDDLMHDRLPAAPTVYVCAQDRDDETAPGRPERLLVLVNAPATGDTGSEGDTERCLTQAYALMTRCGLTIDRAAPSVRTTPADFHRLFPATEGALYGQATHGPFAAFRRPGARTSLPGLYLAGGSVHPGAGVPMAALSGRLAAASLRADLASTASSRRAGMPGGTSTR